MRIRDISIDDIRSGVNWRVIGSDLDGPMEEYMIEPLQEFADEDDIVYSGLLVHLKELGEPRTRFRDRILGRGRRISECQYAPLEPKELTAEMIPVVRPLLMVTMLNTGAWDYCQLHSGRWSQIGLGKANSDVPLTTEFIANPPPLNLKLTILREDYGISRDVHRKGFRDWVTFLV